MIEFHIKDMTCGHCAARITQAIKVADTAARVDIELTARRVRIDSRLTPDEILQAIRSTGYTPEAVRPAG